MSERLNPYTATLHLMQPLIDFSYSVQSLGLEHSLIELVKIRASQINGCAVCLHMHARDARKHGETEERILMLDAWRELPLYSERERAALAWTEALTLLTQSRAPDDVYEEVAAQFTPEDMVKLTLMITTINSFNRFGVGFRVPHAASPKRQAAA